MIEVRRAAALEWEPRELWSLLAEGTDLPEHGASWSSRVATGADGTLRHERCTIAERARRYEFELIDQTGARCFAEAITVRPHHSGSLIELTGDVPNDELAQWLDQLFVDTLRSLAKLADDRDGP